MNRISNDGDKKSDPIVSMILSYSDARKKLDALHRERFEEIFGMTVEAVSEDPAILERFVNGSDPAFRAHAISFAAIYTDCLPPIEERVYELAVTDSNIEVRGAAVSCLGRVYSRTGDKRSLRLLIARIMDENEAEIVRKASYLGVLDFERMQDLGMKQFFPERFHFPEDVDLVYVSRLRDESEGGVDHV